jgi:hypothetical protein
MGAVPAFLVTHPFRNILKTLLLAGLVLLALGVGSAAARDTAAAKAKPPCWKTLINDWYDGRIDGTYPIHCYSDALKHLPTDIETYSSARDDIKQALQQRITQGTNGGHTTTTTTGGSTTAGPGGSGGGGKGRGSGPTSTGPKTGPGKTTSGPIQNVFDATKPGHADSVPVPLIVLGGVALLLMAAGGVGFLARRTRTRRLQLASAAATPPAAGKPPGPSS